jgi:HAD superfamily hydrolase (TIGR01457 family)
MTLAGLNSTREVGPVAGRYDALLVDLDGVVYRGDQPVIGAAEALGWARDLGSRVLFITNNSARTPEQVAERLAGFGVLAAAEDVLTSGLALVALLRREEKPGRTAFVIGERGVREALEGGGFALVDGDPDRADLVVVGWDRSLDYAKLRTAALLVQRGARLVATNADRTYPAPDGLWPGAGAILAAVVAATSAVPTVIGKPNRPLFEAAAERTGSSRPLVVGDRLDTDIEGAAGMGWDSLLVLTGASSTPELLTARAVPTFVSSTLDLLGADVPPARFRPARPGDGPAIRALLEDSGLSATGVEDRLAGTLVSASAPAEGAALLDATACLVIVEGYGLVRSVAVRSAARGSGLGMLAMAAVAREARALGIEHLSLFTETASEFFERLGFRAVERHELPPAVAASDQANEECARSGVPMVVRLAGADPGG